VRVEVAVGLIADVGLGVGGTLNVLVGVPLAWVPRVGEGVCVGVGLLMPGNVPVAVKECVGSSG
jgi:hypothetical protein